MRVGGPPGKGGRTASRLTGENGKNVRDDLRLVRIGMWTAVGRRRATENPKTPFVRLWFSVRSARKTCKNIAQHRVITISHKK